MAETSTSHVAAALDDEGDGAAATSTEGNEGKGSNKGSRQTDLKGWLKP